MKYLAFPMSKQKNYFFVPSSLLLREMNWGSNLFPFHLWTWMFPKYTCMMFNLKPSFISITWKSKWLYSSTKSFFIENVSSSFLCQWSLFLQLRFFLLFDKPPPVKLLIEELCFPGTPIIRLVFWRPACMNFWVLILPNECFSLLVPCTVIFHCTFKTSHLFLNGGFELIISHHMNQQQLKNFILQEKLSLPGKNVDILVTASSWNTTDVSEEEEKRIKILSHIYFFFLCPSIFLLYLHSLSQCKRTNSRHLLWFPLLFLPQSYFSVSLYFYTSWTKAV